jgi:hypothetical protein
METSPKITSLNVKVFRKRVNFIRRHRLDKALIGLFNTVAWKKVVSVDIRRLQSYMVMDKYVCMLKLLKLIKESLQLVQCSFIHYDP